MMSFNTTTGISYNDTLMTFISLHYFYKLEKDNQERKNILRVKNFKK
jgi:hypothetical protein